MLNKFTLFLLLFVIWLISLLVSHSFTLTFILFGVFVSLFITIFAFKSSIINPGTEFLFLQFGFYKYIITKIKRDFMDVFRMCLQFYQKENNFTSILDYVFLNKDSDAKSVLVANLLTLLPGTIGILMKKRYLIVHSLDLIYFSQAEMYDITVDVNKIDDDSLI